MPSTMHLCSCMHCFCSSALSSNILQLWDIIWLFMFGMHKDKTFNSFLWYGCVGPKFWQTISRKRLPILVSTNKQNGGVNYMILFLFLLVFLSLPWLYFKSCLWPYSTCELYNFIYFIYVYIFFRYIIYIYNFTLFILNFKWQM